MAINCIQGTPGSGKSAFAVSMLLDHLRRGGVVAANFSLVDGWAETVAKRSFACRFLGKDHIESAQDLWSRFKVVGSLEGVNQASKELIPLAKGKIADQYEDHGLLVLDECQLVFNSRQWQKNMEWIEFFSQHRKHKWSVLMVSHSVEMVDSQIRNFIEYDVRFRNLNKVKLPVVGVPVSRLLLADNAFLSIWRYYGLGAGAGNIFKRELTKLKLWEARLYDSMKIFSQHSKVADYSPGGVQPVPRVEVPRSSYPALASALKDIGYCARAECSSLVNSVASNRPDNA